MDSYVVVGTILAAMAGYVLFTQKSKSLEGKKKADVMKIGEQMKLYKAAAAAAKKTVVTENSNNHDFPGGCITIVFGSQTGTAEGFADVLKKEGRKHGFATRALDLEQYDAAEALSKEKCIIFVMATYGEGDPTDNAVEFTKFIKDKANTLKVDAFSGVGYSVFGLGNRQYEHFNYMGRLVDDKMAQYGAKRVYHYGEGDDDGSIDEDFDTWKENLWKELRKQFIPGAADEEDVVSEQTTPELEYTMEEVRAPANGMTPPINGTVRMKPSTKHFFTASNVKVVVNRQLRQSTLEGSTIHVEMDLRDTDVSYLTADNLAVLPENQPSVVRRLAKALGYDLEQWVTLKPVGDSNGEIPFPSPASIEKILTSYLSINSAPRKGPLKQLACYAMDEKEKEKLIFLTSKEGKDEYQKWILDEERSYVDVLETFRSVKVPLSALIQFVPFLTPRYYTISSSSLVNAQRVHITVSIISNKKSDGREFHGVCSTHLGELMPLDGHDSSKKKRQSRPGEQGLKKTRDWPTARIFIRASTFRLPKKPLTPIIMIGPGTGIAPMRAFLHERDAKMKKGEKVGKSILFFGCRRRDEDYIYRDELEQFQKSGVLSELHLAFSRETSEKVYVQHLLKQQSASIWNLIENEHAHIYVCGATSMGNDVHKVLHDIIEIHGNQSSIEAATRLKQLQNTNRYIQELWA